MRNLHQADPLTNNNKYGGGRIQIRIRGKKEVSLTRGAQLALSGSDVLTEQVLRRCSLSVTKYGRDEQQRPGKR